MKDVFERVLRGKMNEKMSRETRTVARVFFEKKCRKKPVCTAIKGLRPTGGVIAAGNGEFEMIRAGRLGSESPDFRRF
jgi:hypothetical protein